MPQRHWPLSGSETLLVGVVCADEIIDQDVAGDASDLAFRVCRKAAAASVLKRVAFEGDVTMLCKIRRPLSTVPLLSLAILVWPADQKQTGHLVDSVCNCFCHTEACFTSHRQLRPA